MQTKIVFVGGSIGSNAQTFSHENMHQWWGDNVSYAEPKYTFFKEGYADLSEYLFIARNAGLAAGPEGSAAYNAAFEATIASRFNATTSTTRPAPRSGTSRREPDVGATCSATRTRTTRPGMSYIALRAILGPDNFNNASTEIQTTTVTAAARCSQAQEIAIFHKWHAEQVDRLLEQARRVLQAVVGHVLHGLARGRQQAADHGPGPGRRRLL